MHFRSILSLCLANFATAAPSATTKYDTFNGAGQIRTRWNKGDYADLGCVTNDGKWTVDEKLCGTFTATPITNSGTIAYSYYLKSNNGPCYIYGAEFVCDKGNRGTINQFGLWYIDGVLPDASPLRVGNYGLMATWGKNPPLVEEGPQPLHLVSYTEQGKYVWLTWKEL
ncbi:hypothetical protein QBC38DRAFT_366579 [Podospora fimiseda]|uniref:RNase T2-like C-terminal domain-containing protein n=1 Tax=Podospora fimiseda TaxID=252190 RepID=A0AAN7BN63_9PEZI|nr:hypothetical protein QBC38DRAFT_366579 [Podospora fimiseda]